MIRLARFIENIYYIFCFLKQCVTSLKNTSIKKKMTIPEITVVMLLAILDVNKYLCDI